MGGRAGGRASKPGGRAMGGWVGGLERRKERGSRGGRRGGRERVRKGRRVEAGEGGVKRGKETMRYGPFSPTSTFTACARLPFPCINDLPCDSEETARLLLPARIGRETHGIWAHLGYAVMLGMQWVLLRWQVLHRGRQSGDDPPTGQLFPGLTFKATLYRSASRRCFNPDLA